MDPASPAAPPGSLQRARNCRHRATCNARLEHPCGTLRRSPSRCVGARVACSCAPFLGSAGPLPANRARVSTHRPNKETMLAFLTSTIFAGSAICISNIEPELQFGAKRAPSRAALSLVVPVNLNALDLSDSALNWDPARGLKAHAETSSNYCGCGGEGCPFCRGPASAFEDLNEALAM